MRQLGSIVIGLVFMGTHHLIIKKSCSPLHGEGIIAGMVLEIDWNWQIIAVVSSVLSKITRADDF